MLLFCCTTQGLASVALKAKQLTKRRQWKEAESPEKLKSMYRSTSEFDIRDKNHDKSQGSLDELKGISRDHLKVSSKTSTTLPQLKKLPHPKSSNNRVVSDVVIPDGMKANGFSSRFRSGHRSDSTEEWIVHRPLKVRPKDSLKLEGPLDLDTTFRESYNRQAIRTTKNTQDKRYIEVQPQIFRIRRSNYRPKTSLKPGGEGCYHTVMRDSFKRFVVVDLNNNDFSTRLDVKELTTDDKGEIIEENKISSHELHSKSHSNHRPSRSRVRQKLLQNENSIVPEDDRSGEDGSQTKEKKEVKKFDDKEKTVDEAVSGTTCSIADKSKESAEVSSRHANKSTQEVAIMTDSLDSDKSKKQYKQSNDQTVRQSRHLSLPRSSRKTNKHKNDSQLKFDGSMDFETTSRTFHHGSSRSQECLRENDKVHKRRDLFQACDDVAGLGKGQAVVQGTTYSDFFRDGYYCPASKLDSQDSHFKFKREFGGHSFYCSCQSST